MNSINTIISEIDRLAPMPPIMHQLMAAAEDPKSAMSDIADIIIYDPMITADLIKTCNSAYFALPRKVDSVHDAIVLLGLKRVINLVMIKSAARHFKKEQAGYGLHEGDLWRYSVTTAIMADTLAERKRTSSKQLVFTAALLKDIGKLILDRFVADAINKIENLVEHERMSFEEAEKEVIGLDHAELGGMIAEKWNFSEKMTFVIRNHHMAVSEAMEDVETAVVYLAEITAMMMGIGSGSDGLAYRFYGDALKKLDVSEWELQEIIALFSERYRDVKQMLSIT